MNRGLGGRQEDGGGEMRRREVGAAQLSSASPVRVLFTSAAGSQSPDVA